MTDANQLRQDLELSPHEINEAVCAQAATYASYAEVHRLKEREIKHKKLYISILEAALDAKFRAFAIASNEKLTETLIERKIRGVDQWIAEQKALIELEAELAQVEGILQSLKQKKDMIVTLASNLRAEMTTPSVFRRPLDEPAFPTSFARPAA